MKLVVSALLLTFVAVVGAVVVAVKVDRTEGVDQYHWHEPETKDEHAAADAATAYVRAIQDRRLEVACDHATGEVARRLRCSGRRPRLTSDTVLDAGPGDKLKVFHISMDGARASVHFSGLQPGPAHELVLVRQGGTWKTLRDSGAYGLA